jgi:ribokinase
MSNNFEKLENFRNNMTTSPNIVVMPDFFVDRIIKLKSITELFNCLAEKARVGGGSIRESISTIDIKGGNAVNVAYCLAKLGSKVTLFTVADGIGSAILNHTFSKFKDRVILVIKPGMHGLTTAFEFPNEKGCNVNVMVNDVGDNGDFGPGRINSEDDLRILQNAKAVAVLNWASNSKGSQLAEYVFKNSPKALHFIDPADIEKRKKEFRNSLSTIAEITNVLSINENECNCLAIAAGLDSQLNHVDGGYSNDDVKNAARNLAGEIGINIDLHTVKGAAWSNGRETEYVEAFKVKSRRATGAGDCWDAADIMAYLVGLDTRERLIFSNVCASLYVSNMYSDPPSLDEVLDLLLREKKIYR